MLFLPLLDKTWSLPEISFNKTKLISWGLITASGLLLVAINPHYATAAVSTLVFSALPEEWFFRAYLMTQLAAILWVYRAYIPISPMHMANISTSIFFALLHLPTQGWFGLSVFFPALFFGWVYQKSNDIVLLILIHALSNIIFFMYIENLI